MKVGSVKSTLTVLLLVCFSLIGATRADEVFSFQNWSDTVGAFTLRIDPVPVITEPKIQTFRFELENGSDETAAFSLTFTSTDTVFPVTPEGKTAESSAQTITVPAQSVSSGEFSFLGGAGTYDALYPLRVKGERADGGALTRPLLAVRVAEFQYGAAKSEKENPETTQVKYGGVSLIGKDYTARSQYLGGEQQTLGVNYIGTASDGAVVHRHPVPCGGDTRSAFSVHPPYEPVGGSLWLDFPVLLPDTPRAVLDYACAIRETTSAEPPSDGVTFRVYLTPADKPFGGEETQLLDEIHTDSKTWIDRRADLSGFAGQNVLLTAEINTGPKNDSICDGAYLSGLIVSGRNADGTPASPASPPSIPSSWKEIPAGKTVSFPLADGWTAEIVPGGRALFDGRVTFRADQKELSFTGLSLALEDIDLGSSAQYDLNPPRCWQSEDGKLHALASFLTEDSPQEVQIDVYAENGLLIIDLPGTNPARLAHFKPGSFDCRARRVYAAHGFVAENPGKFRIASEGHRQSASFCGFDFENGVSLLEGTETPPDTLDVDPENGIYTETFSGVNRMAFLPTRSGAFAAAVAYRDRAPWRAAPSAGSARKAGRMILDDWSGSFEESYRLLEKAFAWGVTDSLYIRHNWQRWGYDVRLPDIWGASPDDAPNPKYGTLEQLRDLADLCISHGVPFALHDNYIDFYPDAEGFTYDKIIFNDDGTPQKAWINYGAQTQSYRTRPDRLRPELVRNLDDARKYIPQMDAYFVDVFTSISQMDFRERNGVFHPKRETRAAWQDAFVTIGEKLAHTGTNGEKITGITISEAGSDGLIGKIDGADAQWIGLSGRPRAWSMPISSSRWARTPWFAAVNHTNFIRHGVGYEDRYLATRNSALHGMMSDDYISMEVLGGVDLMVDFDRIWPDSVRKDRLAGRVARDRKSAEIESVSFGGDPGVPDIGHQTVKWSNGDTVYANRLAGDWKVADGVVLPHYGYYVTDRCGKMKSAILRNPNNPAEIVEMAENGGSFYLNGRGKASGFYTDIEPSLGETKTFPDGRFQFTVNWRAAEPAPGPCRICAQIGEPYLGYGHNPLSWYLPSPAAEKPADTWGANGSETVSVLFGAEPLAVPDEIPPGEYQIKVGLVDEKSGAAIPLVGDISGSNLYAIGTLTVTRNGAASVSFAPLPPDEDRALFARLRANKTPASYRGVSTLGAVEVVPVSDTEWKIRPIPGYADFDVTLEETSRAVLRVLHRGEEIPVKHGEGNAEFRIGSETADTPGDADYTVMFAEKTE